MVPACWCSDDRKMNLATFLALHISRLRLQKPSQAAVRPRAPTMILPWRIRVIIQAISATIAIVVALCSCATVTVVSSFAGNVRRPLKLRAREPQLGQCLDWDVGN